MDQKKLEKLENIKNYLENDDIVGLNKYIERIRPAVKDDEDFTDIFEEMKNKNYDQALFLTEEIIYDTNSDANVFEDDFDKLDLDDFDQKDDFMFDPPEDHFEDFSEEQFDDDLTYYEDKDDDYY